jgi:hypothetical protein
MFRSSHRRSCRCTSRTSWPRGSSTATTSGGCADGPWTRASRRPYASFVYKSGDLPQDEREREVDVADKVDPQWLLEKLRQDPDGEMDLGIPGEPGSGLTVEAPEWRKERQTAR